MNGNTLNNLTSMNRNVFCNPAVFKSFRPPSLVPAPKLASTATIVRPMTPPPPLATIDYSTDILTARTSTPVSQDSIDHTPTAPTLLPNLPEVRFRFTNAQDIQLLKEILADHPCRHPPKTKARANRWTEVVTNLNFSGATQRSIEHHFGKLKTNFIKKSSKYVSGDGAALSEVEKLLQDIIDHEKMYADKQRDESNNEEERTKRAENLRKRAMEGMNTSGEGKSAKRSKDE